MHETVTEGEFFCEINNLLKQFMFILCIIRRIRRNQHCALICTTLLFYILPPTCFGSSLPSSGSLLDLPELLEIQMSWVVYFIMCGYVTCVPECSPALRSRNHTLNGIPPIRFVFQITWEGLISL
jgi:hypothetical protein